MELDPLIRFLSREHRTVPSGLYARSSGYKEYARFPSISLPGARTLDMSIEQALRERSSVREFSNRPLTTDELSTILLWSAGDLQTSAGTRPPKRPHPSGGALYPIEIYPLVLNVAEVEPGVYHYNIKKHALEKLIPVKFEEVLGSFVTQREVIKQAGVMLLFSFIKSRSMGKYGELAYKLAFLEGGHIGQNIQLVSTALGLSSCPFGTSMNQLNEILTLDGVGEFIFYGLCVGHMADKENL